MTTKVGSAIRGKPFGVTQSRSNKGKRVAMMGNNKKGSYTIEIVSQYIEKTFGQKAKILRIWPKCTKSGTVCCLVISNSKTHIQKPNPGPEDWIQAQNLCRGAN